MSAIVGSICIAAVLVFVVSSGDVENRYRSVIITHREEIDAFMRSSPDSPFDKNAIGDSMELDYFAVDPTYKTTGTLEYVENRELMQISTNTGSFEHYERYAYAQFSLKDSSYRLLALKPVQSSISNRLFVAFTDRTSGGVTYGGGRYVDLYEQAEGDFIIDFNKAYNPYCVYNPTYVCPLAPPENFLDLEIHAGERMYPGGD